VAEGGGLLNRYRGSTSIVSSNLIPSANIMIKLGNSQSNCARTVLVPHGRFGLAPVSWSGESLGSDYLK
jgi:hypothetical protein